MKIPVSIRPATPGDVPLILALEREVAGAAHWSYHEYSERLNGGIILVAEQAGDSPHLCGFVCAKRIVPEWEIENIAVAGTVLRCGVANELLHQLIQKAKLEGASKILLEVRESNLAARSLYEKHGFLEVGRRSVYYQYPPEDAILYTLRFEC